MANVTVTVPVTSPAVTQYEVDGDAFPVSGGTITVVDYKVNRVLAAIPGATAPGYPSVSAPTSAYQAALAGGSAIAWVTGTTYAAGAVRGNNGYAWCDTTGGLSNTAPSADGTGRWIRLGALVGTGQRLAVANPTTSYHVTNTTYAQQTAFSVSPVCDGGPISIRYTFLLYIVSATVGQMDVQIRDITAGGAGTVVDWAPTTFNANQQKIKVTGTIEDQTPTAGTLIYAPYMQVASGMDVVVCVIDVGGAKSSLSVWKA